MSSDLMCHLTPGTYKYRGEIIKVVGVLDYFAFSVIEVESAPGCISYMAWKDNATDWKRCPESDDNPSLVPTP